jgi:hypothetical protein
MFSSRGGGSDIKRMPDGSAGLRNPERQCPETMAAAQ